MTSERDDVFIDDMLQAAQAALEFRRRTTQGAFLEDKMQSYAIARSLEILGEAAKRVSTQTKERHPEIPWKRVAGLRDRLIHDYGNVDLHRVWAIVEDDLPPLARQLTEILRAMGRA